MRVVGSGYAALVWVLAVCFVHVPKAFASPGDLVAATDFRSQTWTVHAPKGTNSKLGLELDYSQNAIKLKDGGNYEWYFESPAGFFPGGIGVAYNGSILVQMQSLEWEGTYKEGFDIVLVSSKKGNTIGIKNIKKDGDTSKLYTVAINEEAGWEYVNPVIRKGGGYLRSKVVREQIIIALNTLTAIRVRGGYYMGVEKTQLRSLKVVQGVMAGDEVAGGGVSADGCCAARLRNCVSPITYSLLFNNPGMDCEVWLLLSEGTLAVGDEDTTATIKTLRLQPSLSAPDWDYYVNKRLQITSGTGVGSEGTISAYLGKLEWTVGQGITRVVIDAVGSGCVQGGLLTASDPSGHGFQGSFDVLYTIPSVTVSSGGIGCTGTTESFSVNTVSATGAVTALTPAENAVTGTGYISGQAVVTCAPNCAGSGLDVTCTAVDGDVTQITINDGGAGYDLVNPPTVRCPEGNLTATDVSGGGSGFAAVFATDGNGAIDGVTVTAAGSGYTTATTITVEHSLSTCIEAVLAPELSGYFSAVTILDNGEGYTGEPIFNIYSGGEGCDGWSLRCQTGEATPSTVFQNATGNTTVYLGLGASHVDGFYDGMTLVMTSGPAAGKMAVISSYSAAERSVSLEGDGLPSPPLTGDGYAITGTPPTVLQDTARSVDFLSMVVGSTTGALECTCNGNSFSSLDLCAAASDACAAGGCTCTVPLDANAPAQHDIFKDELIFFTNGTDEVGRITAYNGNSKTATVAVAGSAVAGCGRQLNSNVTVGAATSYVVSASYLTRVRLSKDGSTADALTDGNSSYQIAYRDFSGPEEAHRQARPFFCEQAVGDNPPAPFISLPFRRSFGFRSVPVIPSVGTLTIALESTWWEGLVWKDYSLTVWGEKNENLGSLFTNEAHFQAFQDGGPVYDSLTISQEKMLALSADGDIIFHITSSQEQPEGQLRIRYMRLDFSPSAMYAGNLATDLYHVRDNSDHTVTTTRFEATFFTPPDSIGTPASDGILTVTADADLAEGYLEVQYGTDSALLFTDWVWGKDTEAYALSEPADVGEACSGAGAYPSYSCSRSSFIELNQSRTHRHTAHHRIPRKTLASLVEKGYMTVALLAKHETSDIKISPLKLSYSLLSCHLMSISEGQLLGTALYRPSYLHLTFDGDAPPAAGAATLWVRAFIQDHSLHVQGSAGVPYGVARSVKTDKGEQYWSEVDVARDPRPGLPSRHKWPHLGALRILAGNEGQFIDHMFLRDLSQYDSLTGYVDSISIPLEVMVQFANSRKVSLTVEVPPGDGIVRIYSLVLAYPALKD